MVELDHRLVVKYRCVTKRVCEPVDRAAQEFDRFKLVQPLRGGPMAAALRQ
jgi:hypothetical protein